MLVVLCCMPAWVHAAPPTEEAAVSPAPGPAPLDTLSLGALGMVSGESPPATSALGPDEVELADGGFVRGTIVELRPGVLVRIVVVGESSPRTFTWAEVGTVVRGKYEPDAAAVATSEPPPTAVGTGPRVHLLATRPTRGRLHLFEISGASVGTAYGYGRTMAVVASSYQRVCVEPCAEVLDTSRGSPYVVNAEGMMPTRTFELPRAGEVTIEVGPRRRALVGGGLALSFIGIAFMVTGLTFAVVEGVREDTNPGRLVGWSALAVGGGGLTAGGLVMSFIRSKVRIRPGAPAAPG
jgi:hypothetical protein